MDILQQDQPFQLNCVKHQNNPIEFIQTKEIQQHKQLFYCAFCQDEDHEYKSSNYILIKRILQQDNQIIDKYPPLLDDSLYKKFQQCHNQNNQESKLCLKIESFFENLKSETIQKIESIKKKMMNYSESFPNNSNCILNKFQELSKINTLKKILTNQNIDFNQKENQFRELMLDLESQKQNNTETLNSLLNKYQQTQNLIDFETGNQIKSQIIQLIDQINIFTLDKNVIDSINNNQKDNNDKKNTNLIFNLISTKSNYCSEKFLNQVKSLLGQISPLIERSIFEDAFIKDKKSIDFSNINNRYLDIINDFASYFSGLTNKSEDQMNEMKNIPEIKQIMNVLNLKSNYLKQEYLVEFEKYLVETSPLLNKIKFNTIFKDNHKISILQEISDQTLNNMIKLMKKINELQRNGNEGNQSFRIKQKVLGYINEDYEVEDLNKLFQNYPIFDLLNPIKFSNILSSMQMIKTNFKKSQQQLQIVKNQNNQISISQNIDRCWTNCVSDFILDENTTYVFRFQFNSNTLNNKQAMVGLIRDSQKDISEGYEDKMCCLFFTQNFYYGSWGIDKKERGDFSVLGWDQVIEMRVNIKKQVLQMLDYPNYNHILSITDEHKNKLKEYQNLRLYIGQYYQSSNIQLICASKNTENK